MKRTAAGITAFVLTAALSLSACGASADASGGARTLDVSTSGGALQSRTLDASGGTLQAQTLDVGTLAADAFSDRDLSGTWDAASAVLIALNGDAIACNSGAVTVSGALATITAAGTYRVTGTLENGSLIVDAGKEDKVQIVLDNASITSGTFAALYVKQADKVFLTLADGTVNTLSNGGAFETIDENNVDGAVFSKDDLTLNGGGKLVVNSPAKHGVVSKDELTITGGTYEVTAASHALSAKDEIAVAGGTFTLKAGKDGLHAENGEDSAKGNIYLAGGTLAISASDDGVTASGVLQVDGGALDVTAAEGLEANYIRVNDGTIRVQAADDGINAARKSGAATPTIEINGGDISVAVGQGDTDCIDANGNLIITGGTVSVTGNSGFDIDGTVTFTGGTVIVNGQKVTSIPNQMGMGGRGGFGRNRAFADAQTGATGKGNRPNQGQDGVTQSGGSEGQTGGNKTQDGMAQPRGRRGQGGMAQPGIGQGQGGMAQPGIGQGQRGGKAGKRQQITREQMTEPENALTI
ncbi:MAG: carbohydrate-binding domain-containing protein [Oscillibacter sp.]|nr:carbohydrate-binding domain-containing protein [Oscillibacter sp.]